MSDGKNHSPPLPYFIHPTAVIDAQVTIGRYAFVGDGAVITKGIPDYALVVGNPARQIGWMCQCGIKLNPRLICETATSAIRHLQPACRK